jgi:hypothetical protein
MLGLHGTSHRTQHADPAVLQKRGHVPTILMHALEAERGIPARIQLQDPVTTRMRRHELSDVVDALLDAEPVAVRFVVVLRDLRARELGKSQRISSRGPHRVQPVGAAGQARS